MSLISFFSSLSSSSFNSTGCVHRIRIFSLNRLYFSSAPSVSSIFLIASHTSLLISRTLRNTRTSLHVVFISGFILFIIKFLNFNPVEVIRKGVILYSTACLNISLYSLPSVVKTIVRSFGSIFGCLAHRIHSATV